MVDPFYGHYTGIYCCMKQIITWEWVLFCPTHGDLGGRIEQLRFATNQLAVHHSKGPPTCRICGSVAHNPMSFFRPLEWEVYKADLIGQENDGVP